MEGLVSERFIENRYYRDTISKTCYREPQPPVHPPKDEQPGPGTYIPMIKKSGRGLKPTSEQIILELKILDRLKEEALFHEAYASNRYLRKNTKKREKAFLPPGVLTWTYVKSID